jgi:hypothetical protein
MNPSILRQESRDECVTREDLVLFINACFACSGQREFYSDSKGQTVAIDFLHRYILGNYRRLYARTLSAGVNHFNQGLIIVNLLATGRDTPAQHRVEENHLITTALRALPPQRVFRLFETLRNRRVNNRRTRAVIRGYLTWRGDPVFDAVKYRNRLRIAACHAHATLPGEMGYFLFRGWKQRRYETPLFETYRQAHFAKGAVFDLPYTVAEGLAARHGIPRAEFMAGIIPRMTAAEKLRLQSAAPEGLDLDFDLSRAPLTKLAIYIASLASTERNMRETELQSAMRSSAERAFRRGPCRLGKVAAVLDRSYSASGSSEKRRRPLAVAMAASQILRRAAAEYRAFWTPALLHDTAEVGATANGQTDLATPLLDAFEWGAELVVIVSDGYENDPPGATAQVLRAYRKRLDPACRRSVVHMNPVFDAEDYVPKGLGPGIPTLGLRDAEDLLTVLGFARFAEGTAPLHELEQYLEGRVATMLAPKEKIDG